MRGRARCTRQPFGQGKSAERQGEPEQDRVAKRPRLVRDPRHEDGEHRDGQPHDEHVVSLWAVR